MIGHRFEKNVWKLQHLPHNSNKTERAWLAENLLSKFQSRTVCKHNNVHMTIYRVFSIFFLEMALKTQIPDHHCHQQIGRLYQMMASFCHVGPLRLFEAVCYVFPFGPHTGLKLNVFSMDWAFP